MIDTNCVDGSRRDRSNASRSRSASASRPTSGKPPTRICSGTIERGATATHASTGSDLPFASTASAGS